jgi:tRNA-modifying protein YgfZ
MTDLETAEDAFATAVAAVSTRCDVVEAAGSDAASFLQGQLSQDIDGLAVGISTQSLLLQPQGKVDAWMRVTRLEAERFWLDVDAGYGSLVEERLRRFKIRVKVDLTLHPDLALVAVRGPEAAAGPAELGLAVPPGAAVLEWVAGAARGAPAGFDVVGPDVALPEGLLIGPVEALEAWRIRWGIPAMGHELDTATIPAAAGIVAMSVSFTKGCYVGQELVARIDSRGATTPTNLRGLRFSGPDGRGVRAGALILAGGAEVGRVTSVAPTSGLGPIGLGYCRRTVEVPALVTVRNEDGHEYAAEVVELPLA